MMNVEYVTVPEWETNIVIAMEVQEIVLEHAMVRLNMMNVMYVVVVE